MDLVVSAIVGSAALVPVLGQVVGTVLLGIFWLFRDVKGASPGKLLLHLSVANRSGGRSTTKQRLIRNLPFVISIAPLVLPVIGYPIAGVLESCALAGEAIMLLATGERMFDKLAGTKVINRSGPVD